MENFYINHIAVFVCGVVSLFLGALWYSPLMFYQAWLEETSLTEEDLKNANPARTYALAFIFSWLMSYNLAFFLGDPKTDWSWGAISGFLVGFGWVGLMFAVVSLFEQRSRKFILINGGYIVVYFTLIGFILGIWR